MPPGLTLTGLDQAMGLGTLQGLLDMGRVELAFLYSLDEASARFVELAWMQVMLPRLRGRLALHVCGPRARRQLRDGGLGSLMSCLARVQVNGAVHANELPGLLARVPLLVTQHDAVNAPLAAAKVERHALLVDASGGRGLLPVTWERPETAKPVGFAGGLSPDNLGSQMPKIAAVARGDWWVDMESQLRNEEDCFDEERARRAVRVMDALHPLHAG